MTGDRTSSSPRWISETSDICSVEPPERSQRRILFCYFRTWRERAPALVRAEHKMRRRVLRSGRLALAAVLLGSCKASERPVFKLLSAVETGISFQNTITTSDSLNEQTDPYVYNGAGVAVGDIDNDGLQDIFFAGNMVSSRLYRNKGGMHFEDITKSAGVATARWATGVTMIDINNDGHLDIYVSMSGPQWSKGEDRANLL